MAYAALSSLMYTLNQSLNPNQSLVCRCCTQQHLESLCQNLSALQHFLDNTTTRDIRTLKVVEKRIRNVVYNAQGKVDSSLRSIILADCEYNRQKACTSFYEELLKVDEQVYFLKKEVMLIKFNNHGSKSAEIARISYSLEKSTIDENTIVGMKDDFDIIFDRLTAQTDKLTVIPIFGMGGIGKTTLARKVYVNSYIRSRFDKYAWVHVSQEYNKRQMLLEVASSITIGSNQEMSDDKLMEFVYRGLKGRRFLIVIDDIWSTEAWDQIQRIFPNDDKKSRILLTTRLKNVADYVSCPDFPPHSKPFLSPDDSWNLFTKKIFKKDVCPPLLVEIGKHIIQQCRGLPLSVIVVAGLVGKMDATYDNWKKVEDNLNSFFGTASERCESILSLSYRYLPQYLRACFLYVGGFREDTEINVSQLIKLWIAEQFVKARNNKRLEVVAEEYLEELVDRSLIFVGKQGANGRMRTCKIHNLLRQLCVREAQTANGLYEINGDVPEAIYYSMWHNGGITRTFIAMPNFSSDYPRSISLIVSQLKLLKVLDVLSVNYDFSCVIPELIHLIYVAARTEAVSLAKLRNLQTIILASYNQTGLKQPVDIWRMTELRHLDIRWPLHISNPVEAENNSIGEHPLFLNNLHTLYLHHSPFVAEIIRRSPNLKKLRILHDSKHPTFDSLSLLHDLETLCIATFNPMIFSGDIFPPNLKKLRLSNTRLPWEVVNLLANLPNLEVLKGYDAFTGTNWRLNEDVVFRKLKYLQIINSSLNEDVVFRKLRYLQIINSSLKRWEASSDNFPMLEKLILFGLNKLEEIPESIGDIMTLKFIQVNYCSFGAVISAKKIQQEQQSLGNELQVQITHMGRKRRRS